MAIPLHRGDLLHCPHCHAWHPVVGKPDATHDSARSLLYWDCEEDRYFAGTVGGTARYPTRRTPEHSTEG